jgi:hypothetical protein
VSGWPSACYGLNYDTRSVGDDLQQARGLALLIRKSEEAVETFLAH